MGAKAWFIACYDDDPKAVLAATPPLDETRARGLAARFFPRAALDRRDDGRLDFLDPDDDQLLVGAYPGLTIVAHAEHGADHPSTTPHHWLDRADARPVWNWSAAPLSL